jgi:hypothetical protein
MMNDYDEVQNLAAPIAVIEVGDGWPFLIAAIRRHFPFTSSRGNP